MFSWFKPRPSEPAPTTELNYYVEEFPVVGRFVAYEQRTYKGLVYRNYLYRLEDTGEIRVALSAHQNAQAFVTVDEANGFIAEYLRQLHDPGLVRRVTPYRPPVGPEAPAQPQPATSGPDWWGVPMLLWGVDGICELRVPKGVPLEAVHRGLIRAGLRLARDYPQENSNGTL